jgi:hypothetical protein
MFGDYGGALIVEEIADRFSAERTRFVAASATSEMPTADGWENPTPQGISLALMHILDMLGRVQINPSGDVESHEESAEIYGPVDAS